MSSSEKGNNPNDGLGERSENGDTGVNATSVLSDAKAQNADIGKYESNVPLKDTSTKSGKMKVVPVPALELGDYLNRYVRLTSVTVQNSDANMSKVTSFDPWSSILAYSRVREKLNGFAFCRSSLDILVVPAVPGNAQGLYALTAVPEGYAYDPQVTQANPIVEPTPHQCFNTDIYATLDIAAATAYSFTLPWTLPTDFASVAACGIGSWTLYFFCITGVQSGIPSGLTTGAYTIYGRMSDDLVLAGGRFEAKRMGGEETSKPDSNKLSSKVKGLGSLASLS